MCISWYWKGQGYAERTSPEVLQHVQGLINEAEIITGFNYKFDMHWLRNNGIHHTGKRIFDTQLAEFLLTRQTESYPSLEGCAVKYGLGHKIDVIKNEYWKKGIDTDQIPWPVLQEYAIQDAVLTAQLFEHQLTLLNKDQKQLLNLLNQDLVILQEMEWHGLHYDAKLCEERSAELNSKKQKLEQELAGIYPDVPINFGSSDQLSAFLYGGTIKETVRVHDGFFKSGKQAGQPRFRNEIVLHTLPRLYEPIEGSKTAKENTYSTAEGYLLKLKGGKKAIGLLLELAKLDKLLGTYYDGLPKKNRLMNWEPEILHGQFNQCVARTGRLSSSEPNLQNMASELQDIFTTRF